MSRETQANRDVWSRLVQPHFETYHLEKLLSGQPLLSEVILEEVGEVQDKSLIHLLCHIGTDTLSWALLGATVTGVDISNDAIHLARQLAQRMGLPAKFIVSDVMDMLDQDCETYDIVFTSTGVHCWLPDLDRFAATVHRLLKPGGFFYLHDGHPFKYILDTSVQGQTTIKHDYFSKEPQEYDGFNDYAQENLQIPGKFYEWGWTLGEIVTAFCRQGLRIEFLHEYPQFFYSGYDALDVVNDRRELYPCTFSLKVVRSS